MAEEFSVAYAGMEKDAKHLVSRVFEGELEIKAGITGVVYYEGDSALFTALSFLVHSPKQ